MVVMVFKGGDKLRAHLAALAANLRGGATVNAGFLAGATYPAMTRKALRKAYKRRKTPVKGAVGGLPVPLVAMFNEFGVPSRKQPARPFFRRMIAKESPHWGDDIAKLLVVQAYSARGTMEMMGHNLKLELQTSINDLVDPALAAFTIARKGFSKPLIDTGHMWNSVDFEVKT